MTFEHPEYDLAFREFVYTTANELARAQHPILADIKTERGQGGGSTVVDARGEEQLDLPSEPIRFDVGWEREDLLAGKFEALLLQLDAAGGEIGGQMVKQLVKTLSAVTESTGNVIDAGGEKFSFELMLKSLEQIEWSLDEDDELVMPGVLMHPDQAKNLPEEKPEHLAAVEDLKRRKKEELLAQRRRRRLS